MDFSDMVGGIPLVLVVLGLVEFIKRFGVEGKVLLGVSMGVGLVLGVLYKISLALPASYGEWFIAVIYGIALGLVASGIYDAVKSATFKE